MRPIYLSVEGLACFKEKQEVDFSELDLFAISGPTGAGKSTLLDAILFALYGTISRVGKQDLKEMISTARDRVSVMFDFDVADDRFRITRTLRRKGAATVRLEKHDEKDFNVNVADQIRPAADQITRILGLGPDAFTQAVILPQGKFAEFLQAKPRDRRSMLITLLRLEVYERMRDESQRMSSEKKLVRDSAQKLLSNEYEGVTDKALAALDAESKQVGEKLDGLRKEREDAHEQLTNLQALHAKTNELQQKETRREKLNKTAAEVETAKAELAAAQRAASLVPLFEEATRAADQAKRARDTADQTKLDHQAAVTAHEEKVELLQRANAAVPEVALMHKRVAKLTQILGRLPERIRLEELLERQRTGLKTMKVEADDLRRYIEELNETQREQQTAMKSARASLDGIGYDAELDSALEGVRDLATELSLARKSLKKLEGEKADRLKVLAEITARIELLAREAKDTSKDAQAAVDIGKMRDKVARLNQILGRLPERSQLMEIIGRQREDLDAVQKEVDGLQERFEEFSKTLREQEAATKSARTSLEGIGYDADLDSTLEGVRDIAIKLSVARKGLKESETEKAERTTAVAELAECIELLDRESQAVIRAESEAKQTFEAADQALHDAHRMDEANHLRESLVAGEECPVCMEVVTAPPPADLRPEVEKARVAREAVATGLKAARKKAQEKQEALTRAQANAEAAQRNLGGAEIALRAVAESITAQEDEIRSCLNPLGPREGQAVDVWVDEQIRASSEARKAYEGVKEKLEQAERDLAKAKESERTTTERIQEKVKARLRLKEDLKANQSRLEALQKEIAKVTASPDPEAERDGLTNRIADLEEAQNLARKKQEALAREQVSADAAKRNTDEAKAAHREAVESVSVREEQIRAGLNVRRPSEVQALEVWVEEQIKASTEARKAYKDTKEKLEQAERNLTKAKETEETTKQKIAEKNTGRLRIDEELNRNQSLLDALQKEITGVTQSPDPEAERDDLVNKIEDLESEHKSAAEEAAGTKNQLTAAEQALKLQTKAAEQADEDATQRRKSRDERVVQAGFESARAVEQAVRDNEAQAELRERIQTHERELHTLEQHINALKKELGTKRVSKEQLEGAIERADELTGEVESLVGNGKKLEQRVEDMRLRLERSKELRAQLHAEEKTYQLFNHLAADLRSDKFQAYVLEEAFTELVQGASTRLLTLTGERYSLAFAKDQIVVVDHDNAGEMRISDTLSGGETFLTSLSLALELSDQVQRAAGAVNLDSLFIDEGFGTLDPDTLAVVSETIQSLQVGGRMVGIITHIPELRDEFSQQILVTKHQGYSTVEVRPRPT